MIIETAVYDGRLKEWRVLNLYSGSVYSMRFDTQEEALASIEDGAERLPGEFVKRMKLDDVRLACHKACIRGEIPI